MVTTTSPTPINASEAAASMLQAVTFNRDTTHRESPCGSRRARTGEAGRTQSGRTAALTASLRGALTGADGGAIRGHLDRSGDATNAAGVELPRSSRATETLSA